MKRIFSLILALMAVQMMWAAQITVTNTSDDVEEEGSLRWACATATAEDTIVFKFRKKIGNVIHIKSSLSTVASIDGSTWADSIIIDGYDEKNETKAIFGGLNGTGPFVKNIIVQNCYNGITPSSGSILYNCIARNCTTDGFYSTKTQTTYIRCKSLNNGGNGIQFTDQGTKGFVEDCDITGNGNIGLWGPSSVKNSRICDNKKYGICIKYASEIASEISDCVISGNDSIGILLEHSVNLISNNIIGLNSDQVTPNPNGYGIYVYNDDIDSVKNNIISGNRLDGVRDIAGRGGIRNFVGNYVGTNSFFGTDPSLGNGGNGFVRGISSDSYSLGGDVSNNYFGNNGGYGVLSMNTFGTETYYFHGTTIMKDCYFGVTPDGTPMPNGKGGLKYGCEKLTLKNCHIGYNEGSGLDYPRENGGTLTVEGSDFIYNKINGINYNGTRSLSLGLNVKKNVFDSNGKEAIYFSSNTTVVNTLLSDNKFLKTVSPYPAFETTNPYPAPEFTSCKMTEKTIEIVGNLVDTETEAKIELFYTSQGEQTAEMLVASFDTESDGTFSVSLDRSLFAGKSLIGFTATATYGKVAYLNGSITSPLSDVVYPELGKVDLTSTEFYVKVDGYGDGSSWEKAMSPQTFAYYLPQAKDGSTFYVAEGTYYPMYDYKQEAPKNRQQLTFFIKSNVTINGGYPDTAKTGDAPNHEMYLTIFSGDFNDDDVVSFNSVNKSLSFENTDDDAGAIFSLFQSDENLTYYSYVHSYGNVLYDKDYSNIQDNGKNKYFILNGVVLDNGINGIRILNPNLRVEVKNTVFQNISKSTIDKLYDDNSVLKIEFSNFESCKYINIPSVDSVIIDHVNIHKCGGGYGSGINNLITNSNEMKTVVLINDLNYYESYDFLEISYSFIKWTNSKVNDVNFGERFCTNCSLVIENSQFINAPVFISSLVDDVYITNCVFKENAKWTLSVTKDDQRVYISRCNFSSNEGDLIRGNYFVIDNCTFEDNDGTNAFSKISDLYITSSEFKNNIFESIGNDIKYLTMKKCLFSKNQVGKGFSVYYEMSDSCSKYEDNECKSVFFKIDDGPSSFKKDTIVGHRASFLFESSGEMNVDNCLIKNNDSYLFNQQGNFELRNSEIIDNFKTDMDSEIPIISLNSKSEDDSVNVFSSIFKDNKYKDCVFLKNEVPYIGFKQCVIESNEVSEIFNSAQLSDPYAMRYKLNIEESTFGDNKTAYSVIHLGTMNDLYSVNSTYVNNTTDIAVLYGVYTNCELYNNTILSNDVRDNHSVYLGGNADLEMIGNVIESIVLSGYNDVVTSMNNIFLCDLSERGEYGTVWTNEENAISLNASVCPDLFDGKYDSKNDKFEASLKDNGGFTPTVALKSDKLSDGKSIRFPRLENVLTDQRGELRDDMTCMGAYEMMEIDTVFVRDTIVLGETYAFNDKNITPEKIGWLQDTMLVKKDNKEIPYVLQLCVIPKKSSYYYVKKVAEGNGSGSSWKNAMSGDDFAFTLPFANSGTKFYVAEGVYNPIYDASGEESDDPTSLCYRIKNNITIYGGYPADAQIGATADPENHPTIFSGDHKGDDKVVKGVDENGRLKLTYSNRDDNSMNLFEAHKCDATFNNIIIDGASTGIISNGDVTRFYGNNVTFRNCDYAVYYTSNKAVIFIDGSKFENIRSGCLFTPNGWNTNVTSTAFSGNTGYIAYSASEGMMSFESVSVTGNNAQIYSANKGEFKVSNSEFIDNDYYGSLIYMYNNGDPYLFLNSKFINNKTPQSIIENNGGVMTVDNCSFKGNESGSNMIISMAGLIVNHSSVSENKTPYDIFNTNKLTLISDTIESNSSVYIARPCVYGASIDSCFIKNNDSYLFHSSCSSTDNWRFDLLNSEIVGNIKSEENPGVNITAVYVKGGGNSNDSVNIYRTKIEENSYENVDLIRVHSANLDLDQSVITKNSTLQLLYCESSIVLVHNSSFFDNKVSQDVIKTTHCWEGKHDHFINNTIASNSSKGDLFDNYYDNSSYVNNTIIGNKIDESLFKYPYDSLFVGNIVFGNTYSGFCYYEFMSDPSNNLIPLFYDVDPNSSSPLVIPNSTNIISDYYVDKYLANPSFSEVEGLKDIKDRSSEIASLFEGTYDPTTGLFTPVLKDNGGFTPTVALKSDKLSDGKSIRFPRLENVLTDQRGVSRFDETCMGAYETTGTDTVTVRDTIVLGKTYVFNDKEITPSKIGIYHDTMVVKKDNNEVVQVLNLYVKPYALYNCYVKKVAEGTGDGSSWENAMSGEDFAFVLPFAAVGANFYVAEGTYKPIYDELGYETDDSTSLCYRIKNNVSIYGGYPANAKTGATPDPENHPTIFTGDIKGDDKVVKGKDEDGRLELTYVNHDENATQLFLCDGKMTMVSLHDVIVDGASYGIIFTKKEPHLDTDNTTFRNCYRAVYCSEGGAVVFTEDTKFENISNYCLYTPNGWNTHISTTSFTGNTGYLVYTNSNMMSMDSVSVRGNNAQIYCTDISEFKISNSEFVDNESTGNLFYMNNIDNTAMFSNVEFVNNKIVQDVIGNYGSNGSGVMTVDNCIFKSNETGSYLINSTDGLIVRHSFVSDNQITSDMFYTNKLTLLSDTIELNKSEYIARPCRYGASIDSCLIKNNDSYLFYSTKSSTDNWRFDLINSDIVDNHKTNSKKNDYVIFAVSDMDTVNIARTKFIGNKYEEASFIYNHNSYFDFYQCEVDSNYDFVFIHSDISQTNIFNSTFADNKCNYLFDCPSCYDTKSVNLSNNTIVRNISNHSLYRGYHSNTSLVNNTFIGNINEKLLLYYADGQLIGNILFGNINGHQQASTGDGNEVSSALASYNNVMALDTSIYGDYVLSETNIISDFSFDEKVKKYTKQDFSNFKNHIDDIVSLFEGTYDATTGLFTPVLKNNGGFTPTVALKSDKLSDGTPIRFPRLENVLTDQRGVERFDSTCMGAYEMRCNAVDTVLKDTVMVGDSYTFIDKNLDDVCQKVGSYHFTETLKTEEGCDSIVKLSLAVRPQKNENGYYVKEDGTGDGSDWNNAMSPKDFAEYLPLVYDGETFHIAAGTYKSTYVDPELGRMYNINSSVTLIGGYPDTVTSTSTPSMPDVYVTKLTADVNGNDYTYYYPNSLEYTPYSNVKDNDSILIRVNGAKTLNLFGMTLSGVKSCDRGAVDLADGASLVMDRCFVQDNVASGVYGKGVDVKVTNSVFTHNYSNNGAAFNLVDSKLNVQSTAVYENRAKVEECKSEYAMGGVANLENTEATFENSTLSNNAADMGSVFSVKSSKLDLTNNTIVGNQIIPESKHKGSFIGSLDDKSSVSLFGNIVIGNQNGEFDGVVNVASSDYNVFSYKTDMSYGSHDMVMNDPKEVQMLLDGDFAFESETVFIPNIQYNGGYTPTVAVIQSAFDGGKILNIPLDDRKVTYDQRGFVRKDSSCIGAFEFPTFMGYYVKKQAHGDGSGRDWENSMNDTTFAKYFSVVPTNASFYVAEGVYSPMFDSYGKLSTNKSRRYSSSRLVNIYGGYPDSAQTGCVADPVKYKTVLSVDYNGDDKYVVSDNDFTSIDVLNSQDNGYSIVNITSKFPGWVEINGVEFRGQSCVPRASSSAVQIFGYNVSGVNTRIEKCSFVGNYAAIYSGCDTTIIEECLFDSLDYSGLSVSSFSLSENNYLLVDKTTFANSLYQLSASSFRGLMRVQNSTFANALYGVTTPLDFMSTPENTKIEIYNNSFFSGKKGDCSLLVYDYIPVELKGNIISSKKLNVKPDQNGKYESKPIVSDYNVYTTEIDAYPLGENDTIVPQSSIGEIVKGVVENDIFEASLEDEGLYVKKLPTLINVKFEKGGGIKKMPKNATPVTDDQIGEIRPEVDYCVGAIEADCEFKKANFKLELAEEEICRDDTAKVTLTGLTKKEKATYKFAWTSSKDSVYVVDTFGNPGSFHVYARQALVPLQMTITNVCGVDTVLEIMQKVNGVGSVPFDGIEEGEVFCQNESEPVKLTTAVEGAIFTGECVVKKADGYYFDASKAKGDSTRVRCSIQDGDCRSFDEKTIHFFKFDGDEAVEILASTQTKNVCMEKPQAQSVFTVTGWRDGLTCRLNGLASTLMDSTVTKDSVLTVTYGSLKNGEYIFVVSDECKPIASETIKIENEEIDPDMLKLSLDTVVANTQTCDGGEFGDVRVEYSGNINKADVVVVLSSLGTMVKSDTLSEEEAFVVFDNLKPAVYDVKIFFEGMEDCTIGDANYSRTVDVTKPVKFEVAFTATQAICENSIDAMMFTKTSGGNTPYTYKWTKYVGDIATSTVSHTKALHDTLPDLVKNEVYLCDVVDNYGCAASSDTLKIIYDHADSTLVDTFIYDPYQRCKGINNAQMIVDFDVVSEYAHPVYSLKEWNGKEYSEIDKNDADPALNKILLGALAPGKYKLHVGYPSVGCPALIDTTVEIKELVNDFKFEPADSIRMPRCYADNDAAIYFHAIGASRGLTATFSYKSNGKTLYKLSIDSLAGDTAYFVADNLPNDSFVVKMKNVCGEEITYEYNVGAPGFGIEMIDSISFKMLKCRYDSTGIIAFHINTGDYDSTKVTLRYSKPEEVIYVYDDTTYTTVDVPVYKIEPRVKDTIWNADSTDFDVRYERDPETNEIIIDTFVTYEKKDTMIIKKKNKPGIRYVEAVFPCKFDTVYGKDTTFIYSGLPGGGYFIDLVSTIKGCKDSVRIKDTIKIPNPVILSHEVLDISCKSKTDGVISLKPIRSGGRDRTFVLKHDSTFKDGKYEYEMCYIGYLIDGPSTVNSIGQEVKEKVFVNYEYDGCPLMTSLNRISNEAHLYKKDGDSYTQIQRYDIINPDKNLKQFLFGEEWKSIKWTKQDATGNYIDFTIVTPDSTTYEEDVYYSGPDTIKTAVWSYTHLPNFWKDEYGEWLESGVQTIANLSKGVYQCVVTDSNDCVYSTKISVVEPKDPLRIEEVTYDAEGALCDPTKRHIDMKVKGGWGDYNYMVMDGKNEGKGGLIDNYLAATSITYDTLNAMGVYRSQFLDPGKYRVAVVDGKGCRIEFEDEIEVKTNFTVEGSVKDAVCPGEESADATFVIHDAEKKYKYAVKEHIGSCDTPYDCVDDLNFVDCKVNFEGDGKTFTKKITGGGHGFFIYRLDPEKNDTSCGTYVRVSAIDTMKPMTLSKKSISHVTCNGLSNGSIELYVLGGKAPYIVDVNPSWGSEDVDMSKPDLYPTVDPKDTLGKFPRIVIDNLKARDYYFTITDAQKCHQRFGDTATHTAKLTVKEPDALSAEFAASSMCANAGAANDPNYGSVSALDVKGGTSPYLFSVKGGLDTERKFDDGTTEIYHSSIESDEPFIPVAGYKETTFYYTISDANGCELSTSLMFGQDEVKVSRQTDFLATTWSHYGDIIALIDFCGPESTFDSVSYKFSNEKVKLLDKRLYIYDLDNPKRGATPNAKNIVLSYYDTREVPDGFFIDNFNMAKDMTPLLASHINFVMVTDKSDLYTSTSHDANDSLYLKTDVIMSSYFKGCRYQVEINDFLKVAYDNVELYYGGVDRRKNILDIVVTPNPRTEGKPCTVNVYFANNTEDCVLTFYHMDGSEVDRVTIPAGQLKKTKYDYNDAYVYTYNVENERFNNVEVVVISAVTKYDSKGTILLNAGPAGE